MPALLYHDTVMHMLLIQLGTHCTLVTVCFKGLASQGGLALSGWVVAQSSDLDV